MKEALFLFLIGIVLVSSSGCVDSSSKSAPETQYVCPDGSVVGDPLECGALEEPGTPLEKPPQITNTSGFCGDNICTLEESLCEEKQGFAGKQRACSKDCGECPGELSAPYSLMHSCRSAGQYSEWCNVQGNDIYVYYGSDGAKYYDNAKITFKLLNIGESQLKNVSYTLDCGTGLPVNENYFLCSSCNKACVCTPSNKGKIINRFAGGDSITWVIDFKGLTSITAPSDYKCNLKISSIGSDSIINRPINFHFASD